jgi:pimeloyl-ACP methyl ester carboxylesterase
VKKLIVAVAVVWSLVVAATIGIGVLVLAGDDDPEPRAEPTPEPTSEPTEEATDLSRFYDQEISWESCGDNECGTLEVPVDYADPGGETIELALERRAADDADPVGSLVVNPGGPGAPGTDMATNADSYFKPELMAAYDIVGFDPRGTGDSAPVDCLSDRELDEYLATDPDPDDSGEVEEFASEQDAYWSGCEEHTDAVLGHVSTVEAARDMDVLRAALGEEQLHYFGFSYGTRLGSTYAELFPEQVGRFVLDAAIDPQLTSLENSLSQAAGFETALRSYVKNCVDGGSCFLGSSVDAGLKTIRDLLDDIDDEPLPTEGSRDLEIGYAYTGVIAPLYNEVNWPVLDQGLQQALDGDGSTLLRLADWYASREADGSYSDNIMEAIGVINCLDDPWAIEVDRAEKYFDEFDKASPTLGRMWAWSLSSCNGIPVESSEEQLEIRAEGAAPILVVGTTRDPATPYEEAVALAKQLDSGVLLTRDGDGHAGYNRGNACVDDTIHALLIDGEAPKQDVDC